MMIQTVLFLKLDIDDPPAFPRHAEMAVKWKTPIISIRCSPFLCILCPSEFKKKKKRFMTHCFSRMLLPLQFFKLFLDKVFLLVCTLPTGVLFISQVCMFTGPLGKLHNTAFCPSVVSGALKQMVLKRERKCA